MSVRNFMSANPVQVGTEHTLSHIREVFETHRFHHVLVTERNVLKGVISDRDILKALSPFVGTSSESMRDTSTLFKRAYELMSRELITIGPEAPMIDAVTLFNQHQVSCLPVVDSAGRPQGILTWRDLVKAMQRYYLSKNN